MDPFSHYMFAWLIGKKLNPEDKDLRLFTILALIPDSDMASIVFGLGFARDFHGTLTHSIFIALLLGLGVSIVLARFLRRDYLRTLKYGVFAVVSHFVLDFFNLGLELGKGRFLWPLYSSTIFLRILLGIPLSYCGIIYLSICAALVLTMLYCWKKNEAPWKIWFPRMRSTYNE